MFYKTRPFLLTLLVPVLLALIFVPGRAQPNPSRPQQDETSYPAPLATEDVGSYPYPGTTSPEATTASTQATTPPPQRTPTSAGTRQSPAPTLSPTALDSPTATVLTTPKRNIFATEDSEMQGALVTPPASETPEPTHTATPSVTPTPTPTVLQAFHFSQNSFIFGILAPFALIFVAWLVRRAMASGEFANKPK